MFSLNNYLSKYTALGVSDTDTTEEKLRKAMVSLVPLIIGVLAVGWGSLYVYLGFYIAASVPLTYALLSFINIIRFSKHKNIKTLERWQMSMVLILPFALMWSLGGLKNGSYVFIWAFFAPVASMAFEQKRSMFWLYGFVALLIISVIINPIIERHFAHMSEIWIDIFSGLNSIGGFWGIFFLFRYFANDRQKQADILLRGEHNALLLAGRELIVTNKKLEKLATTDSLTGLNNRASLMDKMEIIIEEKRMTGKRFGVCFVDIDRFKQINDTMGHQVGDEVLCHVAKILSDCATEKDVISRIGGDEFVIVFESIIDEQDLMVRLNQMVLRCRDVVKLNSHDLVITGSVGASLYPDHVESADKNISNSDVVGYLLSNADTAMYKAKEKGRNNFQIYRSWMGVVLSDRVKLETELHRAVENEEFEVYFQPQIRMVDSVVVGMEALVRWQHPERGLIFPDRFIGIAEEIGLIVKLDRIVMKKAMKNFSEWNKLGLITGTLSLNLSVKQIEEVDFIEKLESLIEETGCRASCLELEITEGHIMKNQAQSRKILSQIRELGIKIAIDDFGTGYSSLFYLKHLPVDKLKIDRAFIMGLPGDETDVAIVKTIINLGNGLGLQIVAEGVETEEQKIFLIKNGCSVMQGYLCSKPMDASAMRKFLNIGCLLPVPTEESLRG